MRWLWIAILLVGCETTPETAHKFATPRTPPPIPLPAHPSTNLRVRAVAAAGDGALSRTQAMCRPDEQLVGGSCDGYDKPSGWAIGADGRALATDAHTFGAGWLCSGDASAKVQALCLSDPSNVPAEQPAAP